MRKSTTLSLRTKRWAAATAILAALLPCPAAAAPANREFWVFLDDAAAAPRVAAVAKRHGGKVAQFMPGLRLLPVIGPRRLGDVLAAQPGVVGVYDVTEGLELSAASTSSWSNPTTSVSKHRPR
jgi:hypothetical protein